MEEKSLQMMLQFTGNHAKVTLLKSDPQWSKEIIKTIKPSKEENGL